jgi:hypothetical protein
MALVRKTHWATRELTEFLIARASQPFAWGSNDCCLFPADAIQALTGVDLAADFRGKYSTEVEAFALIRSVTGSTAPSETAVADVAAWCAAQHRLMEWPQPLFAQRGDLVVIENGGRQIAGIVHLTGRHVVSMAESGLVKLLITPTLIKRAWHV